MLTGEHSIGAGIPIQTSPIVGLEMERKVPAVEFTAENRVLARFAANDAAGAQPVEYLFARTRLVVKEGCHALPNLRVLSQHE